MASRAVGAQAIGLFKLVFYPPCHVCRLRSIRKSTPPQGRSSARPLLVALIETGWVVSDVSWNNQATRHVKFSAHHPSGTHICHENDLIGHLQPLMKRSTASKRRIADDGSVASGISHSADEGLLRNVANSVIAASCSETNNFSTCRSMAKSGCSAIGR